MHRTITLEESAAIFRDLGVNQWPDKETKHVYFVEADDVQRVKIGVADDPLARFLSLQTASPCQLKIAGVVAFGGRYLERFLHHHFRACRLHGEWFVISREVRDLLDVLFDPDK